MLRPLRLSIRRAQQGSLRSIDNGLRDARGRLVRMAHSRSRILPQPQPLWLLGAMRQWLRQRLG